MRGRGLRTAVRPKMLSSGLTRGLMRPEAPIPGHKLAPCAHTHWSFMYRMLVVGGFTWTPYCFIYSVCSSFRLNGINETPVHRYSFFSANNGQMASASATKTIYGIFGIQRLIAGLCHFPHLSLKKKTSTSLISWPTQLKKADTKSHNIRLWGINGGRTTEELK